MQRSRHPAAFGRRCIPRIAALGARAMSGSLHPLFGFRKGSFTGAETAYAGIIRSAEGGTLFSTRSATRLRPFDPPCPVRSLRATAWQAVPLELQPKLLRFIEGHEIQPPSR